MRWTRRQFLGASVAMAGSIALSGCKIRRSSAKIRMAGINKLACTGSLHVADKLGIFPKLGLKVEIFYPVSGPVCLEAYAAGEADVIDIGAVTAVYALDKGIPIRLVTGNHVGHGGFTVANDLFRAGVTDLPAFARYARERQRNGRPLRLATQVPGTTSELVAWMTLAQLGLDPHHDVEMLHLPPPEIPTSLMAGTSDAISVCEQFPGLPEYMGKGVVIGHNTAADGHAHWGGPYLQCGAIAARPSLPDEVRTIIREGNRQAIDFMRGDPAETVRILAEFAAVPADVVRIALYERSRQDYRLNKASVLEQAEALRQLGRIQAVPAARDLFDSLAVEAVAPFTAAVGPANPGPVDVTSASFRARHGLHAPGE